MSVGVSACMCVRVCVRVVVCVCVCMCVCFATPLSPPSTFKKRDPNFPVWMSPCALPSLPPTLSPICPPAVLQQVLVIQGFLVCRKHHDRILLLVKIMAKSNFPCFKVGKND